MGKNLPFDDWNDAMDAGERITFRLLHATYWIPVEWRDPISNIVKQAVVATYDRMDPENGATMERAAIQAVQSWIEAQERD
jgi:hypothetical protein